MQVTLAHYLRDLLKAVLREMDAPAILFSGGLDTTVLAYLAARQKGMAAVTVVVNGKSKDEPYAVQAAREFGMSHVLVRPDYDQLLGVLPQTVKLLKSFDPMTIRNTVATHVGLLTLKEMNLKSVLTGDGADELFAGYNFALDRSPEELRKLLWRLWKVMSFSTVELGTRLGIRVQTPYLHPLVREFAKKVPAECLVAERDGKKHGKAILRRALEGDISQNLLWREKCPVEFGSGTTGLTAFLSVRQSDQDFKKESEIFLRADGIKIRDKEHLYYYKLYRSQFGPPRKAGKGGSPPVQRACPDCGAAVSNPDTDFCNLCGAWPVP